MNAKSANDAGFSVFSSKGKLITTLTQRQIRRIRLYAKANSLTPGEMVSRAIDFALEDNRVDLSIPAAITAENEEEFQMLLKHGEN